MKQVESGPRKDPIAVSSMGNYTQSVPAQLQKRNYRISEFVKVYGISRTKVYREIKSGRLEKVKCGGTTLITSESAESWLQALKNSKVEQSEKGGL